ncbi:secreted RxLR effector protein 161-like [Malus sylvestris]|uniref:secreted RxLR effector protein 161-like n=1 Tax=Malus sylvestris TaxID=3752 RepID=UPI0021ABD11C|nr:secreted RxLR effector protein 161-like [Malus sylvestris]
MNERLSKVDGSEAANEGEYRQLVGSLLYLTVTRPDVMFAASLLVRFMHNTTKKHMGTAKRVLRYIQGIIDFGIVFERGKATTLIGYCDSDWAGSEDDMRSTSGYAFTLGSEEMNSHLTRPITIQEIKDTAFQIGGLKAPGLDGLQGIFYQSLWDIITDDVHGLVEDFVDGRMNLKKLNSTHIVLISKSANLLVGQ